ncbi:MAG: LacI family transcriptional regulator [candidate division KSB1 bacterium]|nr:LacI family transcriptional regulator [candidate division KSB1 bacterium]MDZ7365123.1 LacI family transcriptional regulator [candidate division KSB1 bacterium]MDZ7404333.1 LacI family transcriptional regulator [candidate division KSB1 bacterium]
MIATFNFHTKVGMTVTIYEVAKKAGVGIGTVSRVLNNSPQISSATRERVMKVIQTLNYQPHAMAQGLARKKSLSIAALVPFFTGHFYGELLKGIQQAIARHKYDLILYSIEDFQDKDFYLKRALQQRRVDGVVLVSLPLSEAQAKEFKRRKLPLVLVDASHPDFDSIVVNNQTGAYAAVRHLIGLGHTCLAMITGHRESAPAQHRYLGFQTALAEAGLEVADDLLMSSDNLQSEAVKINDGFNKETGYWAMRQLLARNGKRPTGVFIASDIQALGAMKAVRESGLRIPEDIAIVGFDDIELAEYAGLTTVRQPMFEMGRLAVERLMTLIAHPKTPRAHRHIETELVIRESCGMNHSAQKNCQAVPDKLQEG